MSFLYALKDTPDRPMREVGGKARNLGRLIRAGFQVPGGFCVGASALDRFLTANGLEPSTATVHEIQNAPVPEEICAAIQAAYARLGNDVEVAVRSSGAEEDGSEYAFAGQFETFLNVRGPDAVADCVRACWASAWNERVRAYAPDMNPCVAVVVQQMVHAEKAGIGFTENPISSGRPGVLIEASWGLGEAVVSGHVTPDSLLLDRTSGQVIEQTLSEKNWMLAPHAQRLKPVPEDLRHKPVLTDKERTALWEMARNIERAFDGAPQDFEWAMAGERLYVLQARPITTLSARPSGNWSRGICDDLWSEALCPLTASIIVDRLGEAYTFQGPIRRLGLKPLMRSDLLRVIDNYLYINADAVKEALKLLPKSFVLRDALNLLPPELRNEITHASRQWRWVLRALIGLPGLLLQEPYSHIRSNDRKVRGRFLPDFENRATAVRKAIDRADDLEDLAHCAEAVIALTGELQAKVNQWSYAFAANAVWMLRALVERWAERDMGAFKNLLLVPEDNQTSRSNAALDRLINRARQQEDRYAFFKSAPVDEIRNRIHRDGIWSDFRDPFEGFLEKYGVRSANRDFTFPRWRETPEAVIEMIRQNLDAPPGDATRQRKAMQEAEAAVLARFSHTPAGWIKRRIFRKILRYARRYVALREDLRFCLDGLFADFRTLFLKMGRRFEEQKKLKNKDQIFFLRHSEIIALIGGRPADLPERIQQRKVQFERSRQKHPHYFWVNGRGIDPSFENDANGDRLKGLGSSPGAYTGKARIVKGPEDFGRFQQGEILIAVSTDPGWTPLFRRAGAVVTEIGGVLNHSSVIAREYNIPAVVGVSQATRHIQTGDRIGVDGNTGIVHLRCNDA